ncbi:MAG: SRPBCC domain-containing protein [Deltaproteobacteria bacterium]|nr:SRPBCC domain-containing protein [Deltaproteobacteria bacterium]
MTAAAKRRAARAIADVSANAVVADVEIAAPPERVFQALTSPDEVTQWWGSPDLYTLTRSTIDLRVGGKWVSEGKGADGSPFHVGGEYLEIDPPKKLVHTWSPSWDGGHTTTITYRLTAIEGGTRVSVRHDGFGDRFESLQGHTAGWERVLSWLDTWLGNLLFPAPPPERFFLCRLNGPRPTFMLDMTPEERQVMLAHGQFLRGQMAEGRIIAFGPVADPKGGWGLGLFRAPDEAAVRAILAQDPTVQSGRGFSYEVVPMPQLVHPGQ